MKILVVSNNYPSPSTPNAGVFVYNLIQEFAKAGHEVTVISAEKYSPTKIAKDGKSYGEERARVFRPKFLSASAINIFGYNTYSIGEFFQIQAIRNLVKKNNLEFDLVYAHFISNGIIAYRALESYGKPIYTAVGESNIDARKALYKDSYFIHYARKMDGYISVSPKLSDKLLSYGVQPEKILLQPNAVDLGKFYPRSKNAMREKYNLPKNEKLVAFVGRFLHHKGPLRVLEAIKTLDGVSGVFIGSGPQDIMGNSVVFNKTVPSAMVPELLSAADIFVLPTLKEGSCNSIVEAMACGLPIVSSDIPEVRVQCQSSYATLVDPMNVDQIRDAIKSILDDGQKQAMMSEAALQKSQDLDIRKRAQNILKFITS